MKFFHRGSAETLKQLGKRVILGAARTAGGSDDPPPNKGIKMPVRNVGTTVCRGQKKLIHLNVRADAGIKGGKYEEYFRSVPTIRLKGMPPPFATQKPRSGLRITIRWVSKAQ